MRVGLVRHDPAARGHLEAPLLQELLDGVPLRRVRAATETITPSGTGHLLAPAGTRQLRAAASTAPRRAGTWDDTEQHSNRLKL